MPAAVLLGALHGLEPGHSKTMMASFLISIRGTVAQAVLLGLSAAFSHTLVIWVLAAIGLHFSGQLDVEGLEPWFQLATGLIIVGMAAWMFARIRRDQRAASPQHLHHPHPDEPQPPGTRGPHGGPLLTTDANERVEISLFETSLPPRFRLYFYDQCQQPTIPPAGQILTLETSRPDGAKQIFEFTPQGGHMESTSDIALGFATVLAFSIGLAVTLVAVGSAAALSVREATRRFAGFAVFARRLPCASVGLIGVVGVVLAVLGLKHISH